MKRSGFGLKTKKKKEKNVFTATTVWAENELSQDEIHWDNVAKRKSRWVIWAVRLSVRGRAACLVGYFRDWSSLRWIQYWFDHVHVRQKTQWWWVSNGAGGSEYFHLFDLFSASEIQWNWPGCDQNGALCLYNPTQQENIFTYPMIIYIIMVMDQHYALQGNKKTTAAQSCSFGPDKSWSIKCIIAFYRK